MRSAPSLKRKKGSLTAPSCLHFCSDSFLPFQSCFRSNSSENESPGFPGSSQPPYRAQATNGPLAAGLDQGPRRAGKGFSKGEASRPKASPELLPQPAPCLALQADQERKQQRGPGVHFPRLCPVRLSDLKLWLVQSKAPSPQQPS